MQLDGDLEAIVEESWTWARKHELISFNCSYPLEWIAWAEQFFDLQQTKPLAKVQHACEHGMASGSSKRKNRT